MTNPPHGQPTSKPHLEYLDCLRGYAVMMVAATHLTSAMPGLPYPMARFTILGWYGVQLFFLMSALTLAMSWNAELKRDGEVSLLAFFVRRYLRIAPAYYLAAAIYFLLTPPHETFDWVHLISSLTFTNSWSPRLMPTLHHQWTVVPGGWSIGTEFSFYIIFPVLAVLITTLSRAALALAVALVLAATVNAISLAVLSANYPEYALSQFFYFWLPNQLPVFVAGFVLYFLIADSSSRSIRLLETIRPYRYLLLAFAAVTFLAETFLPLDHYLLPRPKLSEAAYVTIPFICFAMSLASGPSVFVNRIIAEMGKVSFSGYLLQFAVLDTMGWSGYFALSGSGFPAIGHFVMNFIILSVILFALSLAQYRLVEYPMNMLARKICSNIKTKSSLWRSQKAV